jgi:hypothetical protein
MILLRACPVPRDPALMQIPKHSRSDVYLTDHTFAKSEGTRLRSGGQTPTNGLQARTVRTPHLVRKLFREVVVPFRYLPLLLTFRLTVVERISVPLAPVIFKV